MKSLERDFFTRSTLRVAKDLLGSHLVRPTPGGLIIGEINEVEAYIGQEDPACHAAKGLTPRNQIMFQIGGHAYVYFIYGMYECFNIVTENEGFPAAVLIRSVIPVQGQHLIKQNRPLGTVDGPGKLCQGFDISRKLNGQDLTQSEQLFLTSGRKITDCKTSPRIGIKQGQELMWRLFY